MLFDIPGYKVVTHQKVDDNKTMFVAEDEHGDKALFIKVGLSVFGVKLNKQTRKFLRKHT